MSEIFANIKTKNKKLQMKDFLVKYSYPAHLFTRF